MPAHAHPYSSVGAHDANLPAVALTGSAARRKGGHSTELQHRTAAPNDNAESRATLSRRPPRTIDVSGWPTGAGRGDRSRRCEVIVLGQAADVGLHLAEASDQCFSSRAGDPARPGLSRVG